VRARLPGFGFSGFPDSRFLASVSWICLLSVCSMEITDSRPGARHLRLCVRTRLWQPPKRGIR